MTSEQFQIAILAILAGVGFGSLAGILFVTRDTILKIHSIWSDHHDHHHKKEG